MRIVRSALAAALLLSSCGAALAAEKPDAAQTPVVRELKLSPDSNSMQGSPAAAPSVQPTAPSTLAPSVAVPEPAPIVQANPDDDAVIEEAQTSIQSRNFTKVVKLLTDLLANGHVFTDDQVYSIRLMRGWANVQNGQLSAGVEDLSIAIKLRPDGEILPYVGRGMAYARLGKTRLAVADLGVALKRSPEDVSLHEVRARLANQIADFDAAAEDYDYLVKAKPDDQTLVLARAAARRGAGLNEGAAADYERAGKLGASQQTILPGLCDSLARTDRLDDAVYQCSRALQTNAYSGAQLESRGYAYFRQGKFAQALKDFEKAVDVYPQNMRYLYERGVARVKTGDTKGGQRDMDAATRAIPDVARGLPGKMAL